MFEQTFVDGVGKTKRPVTILLSFAIQIVAIGILGNHPADLLRRSAWSAAFKLSRSAAAAAATTPATASAGG